MAVFNPSAFTRSGLAECEGRLHAVNVMSRRWAWPSSTAHTHPSSNPPA